METSISDNVQGSIDNLVAGQLQGWAFDKRLQDQVTTFYVALEGQIVAKGKADKFRQDLANAGINNGNCSFSVSINLPYASLSGKKLYLIDSDGFDISGTEFIVPEHQEVMIAKLEKVANYKLYFSCFSNTSAQADMLLSNNEQLIAVKKVTIKTGNNQFFIQLPPDQISHDEEFYKLSCALQPSYLWGDYVSLPPLLASNYGLNHPAGNQKLSADTQNRQSLLSKRLIDASQDAVALADLSSAYRCLSNQSDTSFSFLIPKEPKVSVILPYHLSFSEASSMVAAIYLSGCRSFEAIWLTDDIQESIETGCLQPVSCSVEQSEHGKLQQAFSIAKGQYVVVCPVKMEFADAFFKCMINKLATTQVGFCVGKLIDQNHNVIDCGYTDDTDLAKRYYYNHPTMSYTRHVISSIKAPVAFNKDEGRQYLATLNTENTDSVLPYLQKVITDSGKLGLRVAHANCFAMQDINPGTLLNELKQVYQSVCENSSFNERSVQTSDVLQGTILMLDMQTPTPDKDAGSYAAIQEIKLIQSIGYKVKFIPLSFDYAGNYTKAIQELGVEICYGPYYPSPGDAICQNLENYSAIYITRYNVANQYIDFLKKTVPDTPILFNNADLHFLREIRSALSSKDEFALEKALKTKDDELDVMGKVNAILSYNDTEHAVITSHLLRQDNIFKCPWVLQNRSFGKPFSEREGIAFLGGYRHLPNVEAVEYLMENILPKLKLTAPEIKVYIYGSNMPDSFEQYNCDQVELVGYVENLDDVYHNHRIFIAPLISGAGIKGKVLESAAYGLPSVLSPVAAESTGLFHNMSSLIAETPEQWADLIIALYNDEHLWNRLSENQRILAKERYSFQNARQLMGKIFNSIGLTIYN